MFVLWHLLGRYYEARSIRAQAAHIRFKEKAEKYFHKINQMVGRTDGRQ